MIVEILNLVDQFPEREFAGEGLGYSQEQAADAVHVLTLLSSHVLKWKIAASRILGWRPEEYSDTSMLTFGSSAPILCSIILHPNTYTHQDDQAYCGSMSAEVRANIYQFGREGRTPLGCG